MGTFLPQCQKFVFRVMWFYLCLYFLTSGFASAARDGRSSQRLRGPNVCGSTRRNCCSGWKLSPSRRMCVLPDCGSSCGQGGVCVAPRRCRCSDGQMRPSCSQSRALARPRSQQMRSLTGRCRDSGRICQSLSDAIRARTRCNCSSRYNVLSSRTGSRNLGVGRPRTSYSTGQTSPQRQVTGQRWRRALFDELVKKDSAFDSVLGRPSNLNSPTAMTDQRKQKTKVRPTTESKRRNNPELTPKLLSRYEDKTGDTGKEYEDGGRKEDGIKTHSKQYPSLDSKQYPSLDSKQYPSLDSKQYPSLDSKQYPSLDNKQYPSLDSKEYPSLDVLNDLFFQQHFRQPHVTESKTSPQSRTRESIYPYYGGKFQRPDDVTESEGDDIKEDNTKQYSKHPSPDAFNTFFQKRFPEPYTTESKLPQFSGKMGPMNPYYDERFQNPRDIKDELSQDFQKAMKQRQFTDLTKQKEFDDNFHERDFQKLDDTRDSKKPPSASRGSELPKATTTYMKEIKTNPDGLSSKQYKNTGHEAPWKREDALKESSKDEKIKPPEHIKGFPKTDTDYSDYPFHWHNIKDIDHMPFHLKHFKELYNFPPTKQPQQNKEKTVPETHAKFPTDITDDKLASAESYKEKFKNNILHGNFQKKSSSALKKFRDNAQELAQKASGASRAIYTKKYDNVKELAQKASGASRAFYTKKYDNAKEAGVTRVPEKTIFQDSQNSKKYLVSETNTQNKIFQNKQLFKTEKDNGEFNKLSTTQKDNDDIKKLPETQKDNDDIKKLSETQKDNDDIKKLPETQKDNDDIKKLSETQKDNDDIKKLPETQKDNDDIKKLSETQKDNDDIKKLSKTQKDNDDIKKLSKMQKDNDDIKKLPKTQKDNDDIKKLPKTQKDNDDIKKLPKTQKDNDDIKKLPKTQKDNDDIKKLPKTQKDNDDIKKLPKTQKDNDDIKKLSKTQKDNDDIKKLPKTQKDNDDIKKLSKTQKDNDDIKKLPKTRKDASKQIAFSEFKTPRAQKQSQAKLEKYDDATVTKTLMEKSIIAQKDDYKYKFVNMKKEALTETRKVDTPLDKGNNKNINVNKTYDSSSNSDNKFINKKNVDSLLSADKGTGKEDHIKQILTDTLAKSEPQDSLKHLQNLAGKPDQHNFNLFIADSLKKERTSVSTLYEAEDQKAEVSARVTSFHDTVNPALKDLDKNVKADTPKYFADAKSNTQTKLDPVWLPKELSPQHIDDFKQKEMSEFLLDIFPDKKSSTMPDKDHRAIQGLAGTQEKQRQSDVQKDSRKLAGDSRSPASKAADKKPAPGKNERKKPLKDKFFNVFKFADGRPFPILYG